MMINKHIYKKCLFLTVVSQHVALTLVKKVSVEYRPWKNPYFTLNSTKSKQITSLLFVTPKRSGNLTFLDIFWGNRSIFYKIHLNFKQFWRQLLNGLNLFHLFVVLHLMADLKGLNWKTFLLRINLPLPELCRYFSCNEFFYFQTNSIPTCQKY